MKRISKWLLPILGGALLSMAACHKLKPAAENATPSEEQVRATRAAEVPKSIQQQWTCLNRIRQRDGLNSTIDRTLLDEQNQLGVVLFSTVTPDKVPALMRTVMTEMAQEFPNDNVTLTVYASANPPRKMGTAHRDGQTGEVSYVPEKM
ncbi:MAG TPA: hypothetical protein VNW28_00580 [Chthoniobacterales bacterium]|nr:hypothetical protein [Chthoniobacterales bacterium]